VDIEKEFFESINNGYQTKGEALIVGAAMLENETIKNAFVKIPIKTLNRHGLIAGATGTGKTKTLQVLAENLSNKGIPVFLIDVKGDLSGLAKKSKGHPKIDERHAKIGIPFTPQSFPIEILTISDQDGSRMRATVSEFGPVLLSRILELTDTQSGIVSIIFKYCDDHKLPLLDLKDFKKILQFATQEGKKELENEYGRISTSSTGAILRKIVELEQQGGELFFGEKSFEVDDLVRVNNEGKGIISILIFKEASKALLNEIESIVKLIRSKGIGLYFVTQNPKDIPEDILAQLGLKIQHALRSFTAKDRKAIKLAAENYPSSNYYNTTEVLTQLGIGEAFITVLNEKGIPTPLARTMLRAPMSRMGILTPSELKEVIGISKIRRKYNEEIDRESAYELLSDKIERINKRNDEELRQIEEVKRFRNRPYSRRSTRMNPVLKVVTSATFIRGVLGVLKRIMK